MHRQILARLARLARALLLSGLKLKVTPLGVGPRLRAAPRRA